MAMRAESVVAVVALVWLQGACGGTRIIRDDSPPAAPVAAPVAAAVAAPAPAPEPAAAEAVSSGAVTLISGARDTDRTIVARDVLDVAVFDAPDLSRVVRVADDGMISLPLLGPIHAVGRTPRALELALQDTLRRTYMRDPRVSVTVKEPAAQPVYVVGEVYLPGAYAPSGQEQLTVLRALALARGAKPTAAPGRAFILRPRADADPLQIRVNLNDMMRGKAPDLVLRPNDVVYMPKSTERAIALGAVDALVRIVTFGTARKF